MRKCPRNLDKPLLLFGLEIEDVGVLAVSAGAVVLWGDSYLAGFVFFGGWVLLRVVKQGRPAGYVLHRLYQAGLKLPGLICPPKKTGRYSAVGSDREERQV